MRLLSLVLCSTLVAGCAGHQATPAASADTATPPVGVEVRHMYLFAPGKNPVLVVDREDTPSAAVEVSSEPPMRTAR